MTLLANLLLTLLSVPAVLSCGYLLCLTLLSGRPLAPKPGARILRFDIIIPAHNEASIIQRTVTSLQDIRWPREAFRILAVADNCSDDTAAVAQAAGAEVLVRNDSDHRGKGYALRYAFEVSCAAGLADAVVVVDADSEVSGNLLEALSARIEAGANAVQVHYGVRNPMASWRTRLITIAKGAVHIVRSRARERLGFSCGLRGNGWCVTHRLLRQVPYQAFSLTEDVEYGIAIGLAGYRVFYADEAHANADMVSSESLARRQRQRWEDGRFQLIRTQTLKLLNAALKRRSGVCLDLALDLLVLPLSYVALNVLLLLSVAAFALWLNLAPAAWLWAGIACFAGLCSYVLRGWQLSGIGARGALDLAGIPWFLAWKVWLMLQRRESKEWVRTSREPK